MTVDVGNAEVLVVFFASAFIRKVFQARSFCPEIGFKKEKNFPVVVEDQTMFILSILDP